MDMIPATRAAKRLGGFLHRVGRGEGFLITSNDRPVAALVPVDRDGRLDMDAIRDIDAEDQGAEPDAPITYDFDPEA